ncbi:hypothetical protein Syun_016100 [Stephania yunnanensis]|uniref:Uncharacterized protein n=1 Tax=Stephania yunnanensis TaxID=152371 RepID=A0AAP0J4J2_9MAGN
METKPAKIKIERKITSLVKPLEATPTQLLSFSTIDNDPNIEILCQTIYVYKAHSCGSPNGSLQHCCINDPAILIQEALSKALVYYYPLAGRIKRNGEGRLEMNCNGEGVPFSVASSNCTLSSLNYFEGIDVNIASSFAYEPDYNDSTAGTHPLVMQVTKFKCGGFAIGMGLSHSVCDGFGAAQFFQAMAELASGKSECSVKPVWQRERLVGKANPPESIKSIPLISEEGPLATSPYLPAMDLVHECFHVESESIKRLKMHLMKESTETDHQNLELKEGFTTLEVMGAYIWRSRLRALELELTGKTRLMLTVGIRNLINPPLHEGYYGNAFVGSKVELMGKELNEAPLYEVARLIKEAKRRASKTEYILSWLGLMEEVNQHGLKVEADGATMVLTDWRQLGLLEEIDFGWKGAVNVVPVPWKMFGYVDLCIFMPPFSLDDSAKGGIRVLVCLPRAAMTRFKEEMNALTLLN